VVLPLESAQLHCDSVIGGPNIESQVKGCIDPFAAAFLTPLELYRAAAVCLDKLHHSREGGLVDRTAYNGCEPINI
jgi:hypothetical protein